MSGFAVPDSPKHGYAFDGQEMDVRRARRHYPCVGARRTRASAAEGPHAPDCRPIEPGDVYVAVLDGDVFAETRTCVPCALAHHVITEAR